MDTLFLQHFGILGMKWGVRRYRNPDGTLTPEGVKRYASKKRNVSDLSDDDLRKVLARLDLEKRYSDAVRAVNSKVKTNGESKGKSILKRVGDKTLDVVISNVSAKLGKSIGDKILPTADQKANKDKAEDEEAKREEAERRTEKLRKEAKRQQSLLGPMR